MVGFRWSALIAVALVLVACGGSDSEGSSERVFGFITAANPEARTIDFDEAEWLTGDEAAAAAVADGQLRPGEPVPNDYYIRNSDKEVVELDVAADASIQGAGPVTALRPRPCDGCQSFDMSVDEFFAAWDGGLRPGRSGYWVTTTNDGEVVAIEEQYRP